MSCSSKKMRRRRQWEEREGVYPAIGIDRAHGDTWLCWWFMGPESMRVEIPLVVEEENTPWFYIEGNPYSLDHEMSWEDAEAGYGATTRVRLLEQYKAAILANEDEGLAKLREAATAMGLFGKRERRYKRVELKGHMIT